MIDNSFRDQLLHYHADQDELKGGEEIALIIEKIEKIIQELITNGDAVKKTLDSIKEVALDPKLSEDEKNHFLELLGEKAELLDEAGYNNEKKLEILNKLKSMTEERVDLSKATKEVVQKKLIHKAPDNPNN